MKMNQACWGLLASVVMVMSGCNTYKQKRIEAYRHLAEIKENGLLLVRLPTLQNKITFLTEQGDEAAAKQVREQEEKLRQKEISAFREHFDFCPLYFFEPEESEHIRKRNWSELVLKDADLHPVSGEIMAGKPFLIAEFGRVYSDVLYTENEEGEQVRVGGTTSKDGLVLMDEQFRQLDDPYPYRHFQWSKNKAAASLNLGLHQTLFSLAGRNFVRMADDE